MKRPSRMLRLVLALLALESLAAAALWNCPDHELKNVAATALFVFLVLTFLGLFLIALLSTFNRQK